MEEYIERVRKAKSDASLGGGKDKIEREHKKGKLTARERIDLLLDPGSFNEFNMLVKYKIGATTRQLIIVKGCFFSRYKAVNTVHSPKVIVDNDIKTWHTNLLTGRAK